MITAPSVQVDVTAEEVVETVFWVVESEDAGRPVFEITDEVPKSEMDELSTKKEVLEALVADELFLSLIHI